MIINVYDTSTVYETKSLLGMMRLIQEPKFVLVLIRCIQ